jgi:DNA-binding beta-propeller fold protein YncE
VAASPDGNRVAALIERRNMLSLCEPDSRSPLMIALTDKKPQDLTFVARPEGGQVLLVTCRGRRTPRGTVMAYDGDTGAFLGRLEGFRRPGRITARGNRAWLVEERGKRVTAIDVPATGMPTIGPRIAAGKKPVDVATAPDGSNRLFVVNGRQDLITVLDVETGQIVDLVDAPGAVAVTTWGEN